MHTEQLSGYLDTCIYTDLYHVNKPAHLHEIDRIGTGEPGWATVTYIVMVIYLAEINLRFIFVNALKCKCDLTMNVPDHGKIEQHNLIKKYR